MELIPGHLFIPMKESAGSVARQANNYDLPAYMYGRILLSL